MRQDLSALLMNAALRLTTANALTELELEYFPIKVGRVHEWFCVNDGDGRLAWHPPLTIMAELAWRSCLGLRSSRRVVWIGRRCWPTFQLLTAVGQSARNMLTHSLFIDPLTDAERFWAIGQALRCPGVSAIIGDGSGMNSVSSRRLQLAAENGTVLGLLARPAWEIAEPSYAATRWQVRTNNDQSQHPSWSIETIRCRGQHAGRDAPQFWKAAWAYQVFRGTGSLHLSPDVGCGTGAPQVGDAPARTRTA